MKLSTEINRQVAGHRGTVGCRNFRLGGKWHCAFLLDLLCFNFRVKWAVAVATCCYKVSWKEDVWLWPGASGWIERGGVDAGRHAHAGFDRGAARRWWGGRWRGVLCLLCFRVKWLSHCNFMRVSKFLCNWVILILYSTGENQTISHMQGTQIETKNKWHATIAQVLNVVVIVSITALLLY